MLFKKASTPFDDKCEWMSWVGKMRVLRAWGRNQRTKLEIQFE